MDYTNIINYVKLNHKKTCQRMIKYADMFLCHKFVFDLGIEPEEHDDVVEFEPKINWEYRPSNDMEYTWQFNRLEYMIVLGYAYQLTGDEKYAKCFAADLEDWIDSNPLTEESKKTTWRILDAGFRGDYITKVYHLFEESPAFTYELKIKFYKCMMVHLDYLLSAHSPYNLLSNWGVIENHGMFMIAALLKAKISSDEVDLSKIDFYMSEAIDHLDKLCSMAVLRDGTQWEQSPSYHNEVMKDLLEVVHTARREGLKLTDNIIDTVHKMAIVDVMWSKPNHHAFMMGDTDDIDLAGFICLAAFVYQDPVLKFACNPSVEFRMAWDFTIDEINKFESLEAKQPDFTSAGLHDSGNYYFRNDWSDTANVMHFHCGTIGAGHGHSDQLHIDLVANGSDVLMDSGRFTYVYNEKRREYKDPTAHNTITVDDKFFTITKDSWECTKLSQPVKQQFECNDFNGAYQFVQSGHLGYMDLGVFVNRKIIYIKPDIYVISDECYAKDYHKYKSYWHFNDLGEVQIEGNQVRYQDNKGADVTVAFLSDVRLSTKIDHISRSYNHESDNTTVVCDYEGEGTITNTIVIKINRPGENCNYKISKIPVFSCLKKTAYPNHMAEAVKYIDDNREYVITICHQEVNSPTDLVLADDCLGFGNVIVFDKHITTEVGNVLCY